jgi:hypothetical protein
MTVDITGRRGMTILNYIGRKMKFLGVPDQVPRAGSGRRARHRASRRAVPALFVGDRLSKGGNDYPVKAMGVDCLEVSRWQDTALIIEAILDVA